MVFDCYSKKQQLQSLTQNTYIVNNNFSYYKFFLLKRSEILLISNYNIFGFQIFQLIKKILLLNKRSRVQIQSSPKSIIQKIYTYIYIYLFKVQKSNSVYTKTNSYEHPHFFKIAPSKCQVVLLPLLYYPKHFKIAKFKV